MPAVTIPVNYIQMDSCLDEISKCLNFFLSPPGSSAVHLLKDMYCATELNTTFFNGLVLTT